MKHFLLHRNPGNHEGFNVHWTLVESFTTLEEAQNEIQNERLDDERHVVLSEQAIETFFDGGVNGFKPPFIKDFQKDQQRAELKKRWVSFRSYLDDVSDDILEIQGRKIQLLDQPIEDIETVLNF